MKTGNWFSDSNVKPLVYCYPVETKGFLRMKPHFCGLFLGIIYSFFADNYGIIRVMFTE